MDNALSVHIKGIHKQFGSTKVLRGISFDVEQGEFLTLLGPSGCGKTTLLRIIAGFIKPDLGAVLIGDTNITDIPPYKRGLGMVFQNYALWPHMSIEEHLLFGLKLANLDSQTIQERIAWAIELVGLAGLEKRRPGELSGGQQQRVALARAIALQPKILLLDEPLSNLDRKLRDGMRIELSTLQKRLGITTIYVTHDQQEALTMSDRILVLNRGKIEQISSPRKLYDAPNSAFVANFVGYANLVPVEILEQKQGMAIVQMDGQRIRVPVNNTSIVEYRTGLLVIRPENLKLVDEGLSKKQMFTGKVENIAYEGKEIRCSIAMEGSKKSLTMICSSASRLTLGDYVGLTVVESTLVPGEGEDLSGQ